MSNEWEFSCIAQMMQPFPLKYTHRLFPPIKDWRKKKNLYPSFSDSTSWKTAAAFLHLCLTLSSESTAVSARGWRCFFSENHLRRNWKGKKKNGLLFHLLPWRISPHVKLQSRVKALACVPLVAPAERILPSPSLQTLNQHLVGLERSRQSNWLKADSCVNKALSSYWKLGNLHKVCLREGRRGRLGRKEEGWKEV